MEIREFRPEDAIDVSNVIRRALAFINAKDYPEDHIKSMIERFTPQAILERAQRRTMFVVIIDFKIVGTGSLQNDTVHQLFVDPDYNGRGVGTKLMEKLGCVEKFPIVVAENSLNKETPCLSTRRKQRSFRCANAIGQIITKN